MATEEHGLLVAVNVSVERPQEMAGFAVSINGRFWVSTEVANCYRAWIMLKWAESADPDEVGEDRDDYDERLKTAVDAVRDAVRTHEPPDGVWLWQVDPFRLAIVVPCEPLLDPLDAARQIVFAEWTGTSADCPRLDEIGEPPGQSDRARFLHEIRVLAASGRQGVLWDLRAVLTSKQVAKRMSRDDDKPRAVRTLARLVLAAA